MVCGYSQGTLIGLEIKEERTSGLLLGHSGYDNRRAPVQVHSFRFCHSETVNIHCTVLIRLDGVRASEQPAPSLSVTAVQCRSLIYTRIPSANKGSSRFVGGACCRDSWRETPAHEFRAVALVACSAAEASGLGGPTEWRRVTMRALALTRRLFMLVTDHALALSTVCWDVNLWWLGTELVRDTCP